MPLSPAEPRAVLDTNLLVRVLITPRGVTGRLIQALSDGHYKLVSSEVQIAELLTTMRYPRIQRYGPWTEDDLLRVEARVRAAARVVAGLYQVTLVPTDPKDNPIVAAALEGGAEYLVTDDRRDLLPLKVVRVAGYRPVQVLTPRAFLRALALT